MPWKPDIKLLQKTAFLTGITAILTLVSEAIFAGQLDIQADRIEYQDTNNRYVASGSVVVIQDQKRLDADKIEYDQETGTIYANGQVEYSSTEGEKLYASHMEINDSLNRDTIYNFRAISHSKYRVGAEVAYKDDAQKRHFEHFVYSPCIQCKNQPNLPPIWQLKAESAEHDELKREYVLNNAVIEVLGWPVAYTPYFRHPDGTVKRRSGFIKPSLGSNSHTGVFAAMPYFIDLAQDKNLILTPTLTSKAGQAMEVDYWQALSDGYIRLDASVGNFLIPKKTKKQTVGHINARFRRSPNLGTTFGGNYTHTSNPGYLPSIPTIKASYSTLYSSRVFWQRISPSSPRSFLQAEAISYTDKRALDGLSSAPKALPQAKLQFYSPKDQFGGRFKVLAQARHIQQPDLANSQNVATSANYHISKIFPSGVDASFDANLDFDYFRYTNYKASANRNGSKLAALSRLTGQLKMPFVREFDNATGVLEPVIRLSVSPFSTNLDSIPNQDAGVISNGEALLFSEEKISGRTRRDDSTRLALALEYDHFWHSGDTFSGLIGRSFELDSISSNDPSSTLNRLESRDNDYIIRLRGHHAQGIRWESNLTYDNTNNNRLNSNQSEASWNKMIYGISPYVQYTYVREDTGKNLSRTDQAKIGFRKFLGEYWEISAYGNYDFDQNKALRQSNIRLQYEDESINLSSYYTLNRSVSDFQKSGQTFGINAELKFGS